MSHFSSRGAELNRLVDFTGCHIIVGLSFNSPLPVYQRDTAVKVDYVELDRQLNEAKRCLQEAVEER